MYLDNILKIRLNVRNEIKRIKYNPLQPLLDIAFPHNKYGSLRIRYEESYYYYFKSMQRALEQISTTIRYRKGPYLARISGLKYSPGQKKLAEKWKRIHPFLEIDIISCLLFTRILLDRTIAFSKLFLKGPKLPSFTSFYKHKQFFLKNPDVFPAHLEYTKYISENTKWFDIPIKFIRDKFVVHSGPRHIKYFTLGFGNDDNLILHIRTIKEDKFHEDYGLNIWKISYNIEEFLKWFNDYAITQINV